MAKPSCPYIQGKQELGIVNVGLSLSLQEHKAGRHRFDLALGGYGGR
jgi:hypothetical protein